MWAPWTHSTPGCSASPAATCVATADSATTTRTLCGETSDADATPGTCATPDTTSAPFPPKASKSVECESNTFVLESILSEGRNGWEDAPRPERSAWQAEGRGWGVWRRREDPPRLR